MRRRSLSVFLWVMFGLCVVAVLGFGLWQMPRLLAATTYVPPTPAPTAVPTVAPLPLNSSEPTAPADPPTTVPTSALGLAPDFTLPDGKGGTLTLSEQLAKGPVVLAFLRKVGG